MRLTALVVFVAIATAGSPVAAETSAYKLPPPQFAQVAGFLDAIDIDGATAALVESIWQPAIRSVVAANPEQREAAQRFADSYRIRELAAYRPLIAFQLDQSVTRLLDPALKKRLDALMAADFRRWQADGGSEARRQELAVKAVARQAEAVVPIQSKFGRVILLAKSPDGIALRGLHREGLFRCMEFVSKPTAINVPSPAACAPLLASPILARLRTKAAGSDLIALSAAANTIMLGSVAMAHPAGTSVRQLIGSEAFTAAGLTIPSPAPVLTERSQ